VLAYKPDKLPADSIISRSGNAVQIEIVCNEKENTLKGVSQTIERVSFTQFKREIIDMSRFLAASYIHQYIHKNIPGTSIFVDFDAQIRQPKILKESLSKLLEEKKYPFLLWDDTALFMLFPDTENRFAKMMEQIATHYSWYIFLDQGVVPYQDLTYTLICREYYHVGGALQWEEYFDNPTDSEIRWYIANYFTDQQRALCIFSEMQDPKTWEPDKEKFTETQKDLITLCGGDDKNKSNPLPLSLTIQDPPKSLTEHSLP